MFEENKYYRVWADVDLNAIRSNIDKIRRNLSSNTKICLVIKADAYGHGAIKVAQSTKEKVDFFAVATIEEALDLRNEGIENPVLILGFVHPHFAALAARNNIRLTIFDYENARLISDMAVENGLKAKIHIKLDTGMSRIGYRADDDSLDEIKKINDLPGVEIEGLFTHFARADEETPDPALNQLEIFNSFYERLVKEGINIPIRHCSNSAAATYLRQADHDMVRLGISAYGMYPSEFVRQIELTPALSLKSRVIMVKEIPEGTHVGYGGTWTARKDSVIATVPVGYADGYHRALSNKGIVLINGKRYPVVGRVCMDQLMVDVTPENRGECQVHPEDVVILIGTSQEEQISAHELADLAGTINYELTCSISKRVPRLYD